MNVMTNHSSRGLAVALIAAPVVWVVTELISPAMTASPKQQLEIIAGDPGRWDLTMALVVIGIVLWVPASLAIWRVARASSPKLATIGACLSIYGAIIAVGDGMNELNASRMVGSGVDRVQMVALMERLDSSPLLGFFYMTSGLSFLVGGILLGIALYRTADVPRWAGPLLGVSLAANLFSWSANNVLAIGVTAAVVVVAVVPVALSLTRGPAPSLVNA
jgi:hypothetical protein